MKVLLYTYSPVLGGMFRHVLALAGRLQKNGNEVLLVGRLFPEAPEIIFRSGQPPVPFRPLVVEGKYDLGGLKRFAALLRHERPAVVHFHLGNTFESLAPMLLAIFSGYPVVVSEHYLPFPLARRPRLALLAKRLAAKKIGKAILLGEGFVRPYRELLKIAAAKIAVIPPFSEKMAGSGRDGASRVIGFAGDFSAAKGADILVRLAPRLLDLDYRIIFCGRGELENAIDRLLERYPGKIEKRFYATGMDAFYKDIGILLFLSRSEGLPLVVLEAISAGVPVIATRVGVLEEYFREGDGILYLPSAAEDTVVSALAKLEDKGMRERTVSRGEEVFRGRLDPDKIAARIEKLYRELALR